MQDSETDALINRLAEICKPLVVEIEQSVPTTQDHYGDYIVAIDRVTSKLHPTSLSPSLFLAVGIAFQRAGASKNGVQSALRVMGYL